MNDAIALLAISQMVCLAAMLYLHSQVQSLRKHSAVRRLRSSRVAAMPGTLDLAAKTTAARAARRAYTTTSKSAAHAFAGDAAAIATRMTDLGMDVPALARRMQRSEEEVRLLLRRKGIAG